MLKIDCTDGKGKVSIAIKGTKLQIMAELGVLIYELMKQCMSEEDLMMVMNTVISPDPRIDWISEKIQSLNLTEEDLEDENSEKARKAREYIALAHMILGDQK